MYKFLIVVAIIFFAYFFLFRKKDQKSSQSSDETMVECSSCGIFVSSREAIVHNGHFFCSKECLKRGSF